VRRIVVVVLTALVAFVAMPIEHASAAIDTGAAEQEFVARINDLRASKGLGQLRVSGELTGIGRNWAASMAQADQISHNPNFSKQVQSDWQKLGENVGVGATVEKLYNAFVNSPGHYRNLVDPDFTYIGVGVVLGRDDAIFTSHQFMMLRSAAGSPAPAGTSATATAPRVTSPPTTRAPRVTAPGVTAPRAPTAAPPPAPAPTPQPVAAAAPEPTRRLVFVLDQLRNLDRGR